VGFYIAGADKKWVEADAVIDKDTVVVSSPSVSSPIAARYAWASFPRANLCNKEGLPASPFRTDDTEK
jgi:sialate O-acetylesterase